MINPRSYIGLAWIIWGWHGLCGVGMDYIGMAWIMWGWHASLSWHGSCSSW